MEINWKNKIRSLYFDNLKVNESFRIVGREAVYVKVTYHDNNEFWMYELMTGRVFKPTASAVERVHVALEIHVDKPNLYSDFDHSKDPLHC